MREDRHEIAPPFSSGSPPGFPILGNNTMKGNRMAIIVTHPPHHLCPEPAGPLNGRAGPVKHRKKEGPEGRREKEECNGKTHFPWRREDQ
jgi:hypothetical protein